VDKNFHCHFRFLALTRGIQRSAQSVPFQSYPNKTWVRIRDLQRQRGSTTNYDDIHVITSGTEQEHDYRNCYRIRTVMCISSSSSSTTGTRPASCGATQNNERPGAESRDTLCSATTIFGKRTYLICKSESRDLYTSPCLPVGLIYYHKMLPVVFVITRRQYSEEESIECLHAPSSSQVQHPQPASRGAVVHMPPPLHSCDCLYPPLLYYYGD
jgi:hypothetical protein